MKYVLLAASAAVGLFSRATAQEADDRADLTFLTTAATEAAAIAGLADYLGQGGVFERDEGKEAVEYTMTRGWWAASAKVLEAADAASVDISTAVHQTATKIQKELAHLKDIASKTHSAVATGIPPAFEWAQSPDSLFLNVKFAHKLDTPATLGCELSDSDVTLGEKSLKLHAACPAKKKVFALNLALLRDISPPDCSWGMLSVGRVQLTLRKAENGTWPRLLKSAKKLGNMHVWWTMREKYEAENEAFDKAAEAASKAGSNATTGSNSTASTEQAAAPPAAASEGEGDAAAAPAESVASASDAPTATPTPVPSLPAEEAEQEEVLAAEDEVSATPTPKAAAAAADEDSKPTPAATKESAAARRRRLAKEKEEKKAGKSGGSKPAAGGPPGAGGLGGLGDSFTTEQLFAQLAGSIHMRQQEEMGEAEKEERASMAQIEEAAKKMRSQAERENPDAEGLALARAKIEGLVRERKADARREANTKKADIKKKFKAELDDLRQKLNMGGKSEL